MYSLGFISIAKIKKPRISSTMLRCALYFKLSSRCLDIQMANCLSCLIYYSSNSSLLQRVVHRVFCQTRTLGCWTGWITLVTRGTAMQPVPTRDGVWCETTSLSCFGIHCFAAGAVIWTHCHHNARLVLARNWTFSLWPLEEREVPAKKLG